MWGIFDSIRGLNNPQIEECFQLLKKDCGPELRDYCHYWDISLSSASFDDKQKIFCSRFSIKFDSIRKIYREVSTGRKEYPDGFELLFKELFSKRLGTKNDRSFGKYDAIYTAAILSPTKVKVPSFGSCAPGCYTYTKEFVQQYSYLLYNDREFSQYVYGDNPSFQQFNRDLSSVIQIEEVPVDVYNLSLDHARLIQSNLSRLPSLQEIAEKGKKYKKEIEDNSLRKQYITQFLGKEGRAFDDIDYCLNNLRSLDSYIHGVLFTECEKIRRYYPSGYAYYCRHHSKRDLTDIIEHKEEIRSYNQYGDLTEPYDEWEERQRRFTADCKRSVLSSLRMPYFKESTYDPGLERLLINGKIGKLSFEITSCSLSPICEDNSLDYGVLNDFYNYFNSVSQCLSHNRSRLFDSNYINSLLAFVTNTKGQDNTPLLVVIPPSEDKEINALTNDAFSGLVALLKSNDISVLNFADTTEESSFLKYDDLALYRRVIFIDLLSDNSNWKDIFKALSEYENFHPAVFVCGSLYNVDSATMSQLISRKKKELEDQRRRKEQEEKDAAKRLAEQQARQAAERKEKEEKAFLFSITHEKKSDYQSVISYLNENDVKYFYHFTDKRNLESIKKHGGLFSWYYLNKHNVVIPRAGGNELSRVNDSKFGLEDYVRLSFCVDHPMTYRLDQEGYQLVLLKIKTDVACLAETRFSNINATDSLPHSYGRSLEDLKKVNIRATRMNYLRKDSPYFKEHQAEVMVKTFIPIEYIENFEDLYNVYHDIH